MATDSRGKRDWPQSSASARLDSSLTNRPGERYGMSRRWDPSDMWSYSPFGLMRQMQDQMSRMFGRMPDWPAASSSQLGEWSPAVDVFQRGNELVIRADVPGMGKDDVSVEVEDDAVTIRGDRKYEHDEEREGMFRSERHYGSFVRMIPLPEGAIGDSAKATFKNGVLEVVVQAPPNEVRRGRRLDIKEEKVESGTPKT